jgi:hypothetical protein
MSQHLASQGRAIAESASSPSSSPSSAGQFRTERLPLAAYLLAAKILPLLDISIEKSKDARARLEARFAVFIFRDIANRGPELESQFLSGQALVDPNAFHHQLRTLRKEIDSRLRRLNQGGEFRLTPSSLWCKSGFA